MAYYSTHGFGQFLLNNEKQRVRFLLAHPVDIKIFLLTSFSLPFSELSIVALALHLDD